MTDPKKHLDGPNLTPIDQELEYEDNLQEEQALEQFFVSINSRRDERRLALYLVYMVDRSEYTITLDTAAKQFEEHFFLDPHSAPFAMALARGAIDQREQFDEMIKPYLKNWKLERLGCCTRLILRIALWEFVQPDAVCSIIINEAVELAKTFAERDSYRFVNGVLDEIAKGLSAEKIEQAEKDTHVK